MMYHRLEKKGVADGVFAFKKAKEKYPEIELEMFGFYKPGSEIPKDVIYHRQPSSKKLSELYRSADIFLWPSRQEGFGLPPMEAMACGCAVISTDTGAIREYAQANESAIIIPPKQAEKLAEALIDLISNKEKRISLGRVANKKIKEFTWDKSTEKLEQVFLNN